MYFVLLIHTYIRSMPCFALLSFMVIIVLKKENLSFLQGFQDVKKANRSFTTYLSYKISGNFCQLIG